MISEVKEIISCNRGTEDLSGKNVETLFGNSILIDTKVLATDKWQEMIAGTQKDYKERGVIVSQYGNRFISSKIFNGNGEVLDNNKPNKKISASFTPPFLTHGIRSLLPNIKDIVLIHTHPMPPELDHLKTTIFSDFDIQGFVNSTYNGLVLIDRGGAHLLVRNGFSHNQDDIKSDISIKTLKKINEENGVMLDAIKSLALQLHLFGLDYFYTPSLFPHHNGFIEFYNPRILK